MKLHAVEGTNSLGSNELLNCLVNVQNSKATPNKFLHS